MKSIINPIYLESAKIEQLKADFATAKPCNYLELPNFLTEELATTLYENFPKIDALNVKRKSLNENKSEDYHFDRFHPSFSELKKVVGSKEMYQFMETITGIKGLVTTDDAMGNECSVWFNAVIRGDVVGIREKSQSLETITASLAASSTSFDWLEWNGTQMSGRFISTPERTQIPENIKEQLIVELYSK